MLRYTGELDADMGAGDGTLIEPSEPIAIGWRVTSTGIGYGGTTIDGHRVTTLATEEVRPSIRRRLARAPRDRTRSFRAHSRRLDRGLRPGPARTGPSGHPTRLRRSTGSGDGRSRRIQPGPTKAGVVTGWDRYLLPVGEGTVHVDGAGTITNIEDVSVTSVSGTGLAFSADVHPAPGATEIDQFREDVSSAMSELDEYYYYSTPNIDLDLSLDDRALDCDGYADCEAGATVTVDTVFIHLNEERLKHVEGTFTATLFDATLGERECTKTKNLEVGEATRFTLHDQPRIAQGSRLRDRRRRPRRRLPGSRKWH